VKKVVIKTCGIFLWKMPSFKFGNWSLKLNLNILPQCKLHMLLVLYDISEKLKLFGW